VSVELNAPCVDVLEEMVARVAGEGGWYDPHNRGSYSIAEKNSSIVELSRVTGGSGMFVDKIVFSLEQQLQGNCNIIACSESQVTSVADMSTNYCNIHNLYCGSHWGPACKFVKHDFAPAKESTTESIGATNKPSDCIVV